MAETLPAPVRVLFVCQNDFEAPTEKQVAGWAQGLLRRGHAVAITVGGDVATAASEGVDRLPGIVLGEHRLDGRALRESDRSWARDFAPAVVHACNPRAPTAAAAADLAGATGAVVVVHFEDDEWRTPPLEPRARPRARLGRPVRRALARRRPGGWPFATRASLRWAREAAGLDALTPELAREVEARLGRPCAVILPVTPELPASDGAPQPELPDADGRPVLLFTGTVWPQYLDDVELGLRATAEVRRRGADAVFWHAGRVHPRVDLAALARDAGLGPGALRMLGYLPFTAMPALLARATVLLQPGAPTDFNRLRLPAKLQPYLASGVPTITFAAGAGELLRDREEALLTTTASPGELADRIEELLRDPDLRAALAAGGPRAAARLFDEETNVGALLEHYRSVVGR